MAAGLEELQIVELVTFCVLPSLKVPVAVSCSLEPVASDALAARTAIDWSVAAVTVRAKLFDVIPFWAAVILLEPIATPVAKPVALMLTEAGLELDQVAVLVKFCVLPSLKVPVAVN
jgi:hypothetical protein